MRSVRYWKVVSPAFLVALLIGAAVITIGCAAEPAFTPTPLTYGRADTGADDHAHL